MLLDEKMDHGPLLSQTPLTINDWPINGPLLDDMLAQIGGEMLAVTIPAWLAGNITPAEQDHEAATYTKKFDKSESELLLNPVDLPTNNEAFALLSKVRAFEGIGDTFFIDNGIRVKVKSAEIISGTFTPTRVIPEGKKEVDFATYLQNR
jgi:methionyl-tRNA formyltransferase